MSDFAANGNKLPNLFHALWRILMSLAADPEAGEIICILDAFDECSEAGRYDIIHAVSAFYQQSHSRDSAQLKFLVTSRPYLDIERRFTDIILNFSSVRLHGEQESTIISCEIDIVIKWRVSQLGSELKLDDAEELTLEKELLGMTHRTYLWLKLILDIVRNAIRPTSQKLKTIINTLPSTIDKAYEAILSRIEEDERLHAKKLFQIIIASTRPLTLTELNIALAIEDYHRSYDDLDVDNEMRFEMSVKNICGLFVTVVDQRVYLIHQTAREFLLAKTEVATHGWKHSISLRESEALVLGICLAYLSFAEFDGTMDQTSAAFKGYFDYAACSWAGHYRIAQHDATEQLLNSVFTIYDVPSQRFKNWYLYWSAAHKHKWTPHPRPTSSLVVAAFFGHDAIVKLLLEDGADVESKDRFAWTPLLWAAQNGHGAVVKLLLEGLGQMLSQWICYTTGLHCRGQP